MIQHVSRQADGTVVGVWTKYVLRSAFQPIFEFRNGKLHICAYEALIRPFDDGRSISPGEFFEMAKPIDRFRLETLMRMVHVFNAPHRLDASDSVYLNFDPSVFTDKAFVDEAMADLRHCLSEVGLNAARVVCELTEKKSGSDAELYRLVGAMRANGFRVAIDDYGADDSDFARVLDLKPNIVKFDAGWIGRLMESDPGRALLASMVEKFRSMDIKSLFEGLQEPWQLDLAQECHVDMVQGFILAMPELIIGRAQAPSDVRNGADTELKVRRREVGLPPVQPRTATRFGRRAYGQ